MDVLVVRERFAQTRIPGDVGEHTQLDLRIVGHKQDVIREAGDEREPDLPAELAPDRDVLEVRRFRRDAARRHRGLLERRVHAAGLRVDEPRQRIEIRRLELGELAVLEERFDDVVLAAQALERRGVGRESGLRPPRRLESELVVQDRAQLRR